MDANSKIYIAGHSGLVGSSLVKKLTQKGFDNLLFTPHMDYDLRNQSIVNEFFKKEQPEYVIIAAAKVGGIFANSSYKAEFIYDNIMIASNIIHASYLNNVKKLLFLGSSCIYPKECPQPIKEEYLLTGSLEETNEPYALAKISALKMCDYYREQYECDFISAMPTNLYGQNDNFNLETSHVLPAMIRKIHLAKCLELNNLNSIRLDLINKKYSLNNSYSDSMTDEDILNILKSFGISYNNHRDHHNVTLSLWGSGNPYREFLHSDDLSDALLYLIENYSSYGHINVGTGVDLKIKDLANLIKKIIGYNGLIDWDKSKPDGTYKKLLDITKLNEIGWKSSIDLKQGIRQIYNQYISKD